MNKLQMLEAQILALPDEYDLVRSMCLNLFTNGELTALRIYSMGLRDMAIHLTSEDALINCLTEIRRMLQ